MFCPQAHRYHISSTNVCALQTTPCEATVCLTRKLPGTLCFSSKAQLCTDMTETAPNCACPTLISVLVFMCVCSCCFHASHKPCSCFILPLARGMTVEKVCHFPSLNRWSSPAKWACVDQERTPDMRLVPLWLNQPPPNPKKKVNPQRTTTTLKMTRTLALNYSSYFTEIFL